MDTGTVEVSRHATAWLVSLSFCATFLLATLAGASGGTALLRGVAVAGATLVIGGLLVRPVVDAVFTAMARDRAEAETRARKGDEDET